MSTERMNPSQRVAFAWQNLSTEEFYPDYQNISGDRLQKLQKMAKRVQFCEELPQTSRVAIIMYLRAVYELTEGNRG